jgi:hypothetical protein
VKSTKFYRVVSEAEFQGLTQNGAFQVEKLDNIGPACYGELYQLRSAAFREVKI